MKDLCSNVGDSPDGNAMILRNDQDPAAQVLPTPTYHFAMSEAARLPTLLLEDPSLSRANLTSSSGKVFSFASGSGVNFAVVGKFCFGSNPRA